MMRISLVVASLTLIACARDTARTTDTAATAAIPAPAAPTVPPDVQTALAVKRGIDAAPNKADSILTANGLTAAGFDSLMYRISADSALRAAYASASR